MSDKRPRGRPRITPPGEPHSEGRPRLETRVDRETFAKVETLAARKRQTLAEWTRQAVLDKVESEEQVTRPVRPP